MDSAADGSLPDNFNNFVLYISFRHGLHYHLC